jgi:hypothetical protein
LTTTDPILQTLILIKNGWSSTESGINLSEIQFSTGWYDSKIGMPQITITPVTSLGSLIECGPIPTYQFQDMISINIWVRPDSDSNKSLGSAKNIEYQLRTEVDRIIKSGSHISSGNDESFIYSYGWKTIDELDTRPILLRSRFELRDNYFRGIYEGYST